MTLTKKKFWAVVNEAERKKWSGPRLAKELDVPIVDATDPLTVYVEKEDVVNGQPLSFCECAIANALTRQTGAIGAWVSTTTQYLFRSDRAIRYMGSSLSKLAVALNDLESGGDTAMGAITLRAVPESQTARGQRKYAKARSAPSPKKKGKKRAYRKGAFTSAIGVRRISS